MAALIRIVQKRGVAMVRLPVGLSAPLGVNLRVRIGVLRGIIVRVERQAVIVGIVSAPLIRREGRLRGIGPEPAERAVQALVRLDPVGFAERELADRRDAGFPPAHKLVVLEGSEGTLIDALSLVGPVNGVEGIGPFPVPGGSDDQARVTLRCALREAPELLARVRTLQSVRAARKTEGIMRVRVDPQVIG